MQLRLHSILPNIQGVPKKVLFRKIAKPLIKWPFRGIKGRNGGSHKLQMHWGHVLDTRLLHRSAPNIPIAQVPPNKNSTTFLLKTIFQGHPVEANNSFVSILPLIFMCQQTLLMGHPVSATSVVVGYQFFSTIIFFCILRDISEYFFYAWVNILYSILWSGEWSF